MASDLEHSRAKWKKKCEEKDLENKALKNEIETKDVLIEDERKLRQQATALHAEEFEGLKKNGRCSNSSPRRKRPKNPSSALFGNCCPDIAFIDSLGRAKPSRGSSGIHSLLFLAATQNALAYCDSRLDFAGRILQVNHDPKIK